MNLLVFNLRMDVDDPVLGHTTPLVNALAGSFDHVTVITMSTGRLAVRENVTVHSLGREKGWSEPRRLVHFYRLLGQVLRQRRIDVCFAHMAPLFAIMAAPITRPARIPILLWYAHPAVPPTLRLAHALVERCVASTELGFSLPSDKLFVVGQGIDVERFTPPTHRHSGYERTVVAVGRISPVKGLEETIEAVAILRERELDLQLDLFGGVGVESDRGYEAKLKRLAAERGVDGNVTFHGPVPFDEVPAVYRRGALYMNLGHGALDKAILEAMASGCIAVSRNTSFRVIAEENGLDWLVPGEGPASVADRIEAVLERPDRDRAEIAERLRRIVVEQHSLEHQSDAIAQHLRELAAARGRTQGDGGDAALPRQGDGPVQPGRRQVLFVGTSYDLPLSPALSRKWNAVEMLLDVRVIGRAGLVEAEDRRFRLVGSGGTPLSGPRAYLSLAAAVAAETRSFAPDVVVAQSPYEAFACLAGWVGRRRRPKLVVELHGDWRTASRLYGSPTRRIFAGLAERAALYALRRADATRALSPFTAGLAEQATGRHPVASFPAYFDLETFTARPPRTLPTAPAVAWIGALERTKNPALLARAWRTVAAQVPDARLVIVGRGLLQPLIDDLVREFPARVRAVRSLEPLDLAELLDDSTLLAMSSESEGLGRVILEAYARGRPVVAPAVGGIQDVVESETNGLLVNPADADQLAEAVIRVLKDRALAERLARGALDSVEQSWSATGYAEAVREMVERTLSDSE